MPSTAFLRASLKLWEARAGARKRLHAAAQRDLERARDRDLHPRQHLLDRRNLRSRQLKQARAMVALRRRQLAAGRAPRIVRGRNLRVKGRQGPIGTLRAVTGHYTAGPTDSSDNAALELLERYAAMHDRQWGDGIAYHFCIARSGTLILLRPTGLRGIGVGGHNTGNVHVVMHGSTGDRPTEAQAKTLAWLHAHAHTRRVPSSHRLRVPMRRLRAVGHNDWPGPGGSTACPGQFRAMYRSRGASR